MQILEKLQEIKIQTSKVTSNWLQKENEKPKGTSIKTIFFHTS